MKRKTYITPDFEVIDIEVTVLQSASPFIMQGGDDDGGTTPIFVD